MKRNILRTLIMGLLLSLSFVIQAETILYTIRVDGLACPYCAYGIEKKLNQLKGVKFLDIDLEKGIVSVQTEGVKLSDEQLKQLFEDSGFSYRSKQETIK